MTSHRPLTVCLRRIFENRRALLTLLAPLLWMTPVSSVPAAEPGFASEQRCADCHAEQYQAWRDSHHGWAMREAAEANVKGDFDDALFSHFGVESRFFRRDGEFYVNTEGPDGEAHDYPIKYTFGVDPLQQYLIEFPGGRLQSLTIAWDTRPEAEGGQRWFHLYPDQRIEPGDPLHWTGRYQNWNGMCAECHSTDLQKGYDPDSDTYDTTWHAVNVGCQACHGPGARHVEWAERRESEGVVAEDGAADNGLMLHFAAMDARQQVDACARCHARREQVSVDDRHGRVLLDDFMPATLREGLYFADGQILDEVYVYGSFLQSRMYQAGVRCTDCHDAHSGELEATGNALCTRCHQSTPDPRFPGLQARRYDSPAHHFHPPDSTGAQCVDCHMPSRTYMVIDDRRDHSFRIPRPDLTGKIGVPNACNRCHEDQDADWAAARIAEWYGPERRRETHYGEYLALTRSDPGRAQNVLIALARTESRPAIVRATALELIRPVEPESLQTLVTATRAPDPLLRTTAARSLAQLPQRYKPTALIPLLDDPVRAVRNEAAKGLSDVPREAFTAPQLTAFDRALADYRAAQLAASDVMPGAHLNLAVVAVNQGDSETGERHYRQALAIDPGFLPARFNLANLYNARGRNREAEQVLRAGLERAPDEGELHYSLGLLLAEEQRLTEAAEALGEAALLLPQRARVHYNHGLALQQLERLQAAEQALRKAHELASDDPDILQALIAFHARQGQWAQAYPYAQRLVQLFPQAPGPRRMLREIDALREGGE